VNEVRDRAHAQPVALGERLELWAACHRAVLVHDLDDQRGGLESGHAREVDAGLRVSGAAQDAAGLGHQGKDMPRLR
jgi:hypothetical protein